MNWFQAGTQSIDERSDLMNDGSSRVFDLYSVDYEDHTPPCMSHT